MSDDQVSVKRKTHVELAKSRLLIWHLRIVAPNGEILLTSENYYSYNNARRAGRKLANGFNIALKED